MKNRKFTLIELLIVLSVAILLEAMLLPALGKARESAVAAGCVGNLKQLGQGFAAYLNDNAGILPPCDSYKYSCVGLRLVNGDYVAESNFSCPDAKPEDADNAPGPFDRKIVHFGYRGIWNGKNVDTGIRAADAQPANAQMLMIDGIPRRIGDVYRVTNVKTQARYRHGEKANALALDGHVVEGVTIPNMPLRFW